MAKYIDAIELAEKIKNTPSSIDKFPQYDRYDGAAWRQFEILDMIKEMPAADVEEVARGHSIRGCINKAALQVQIFLAWNEACISGQQEFADGLERALDIIDSAPVIGNGEVKHGEDTVD